jgi:hypothetical protein
MRHRQEGFKGVSSTNGVNDKKGGGTAPPTFFIYVKKKLIAFFMF